MARTTDPRVVVLLAADHYPGMWTEIPARVDRPCLDFLGIAEAKLVHAGSTRAGISHKEQRRRFGDLVLLPSSLGHRQSLR